MMPFNRTLMQAFAPALGAGVLGGVAAWLGAMPTVAIGLAVLGAFIGTLAISGDGTDEPEEATAAPTQPKTKNAEQSIRPLLDALPLGVMIVRQDRSLKLANQMARSLFGAALTPDTHVSNLRAHRLLEGMDDARDQGAPVTVAFQLARAGDAQLKAHISTLGERGDLLVAIEDETQARRSMEVHRDFVANASHELKTPLAAISGVIETLLGHARNDPKATERFLHLMAGQAGRMTRLIEDLLSLNRIELNERVAPDTNEDLLSVVSEVVEVLRPVAEVADVTLASSTPPNGVTIKADREQLVQLFQNLIDNAIKYGGRGTMVTIALADVPPPLPGMFGVTVRDEGPGIARVDIPRVTERFYRVNSKAHAATGTGLGLSICQHIVNRHRGRLEITSQLEEGSAFTVWLPVEVRENEDSVTPANQSDISQPDVTSAESQLETKA